MLNPADIATNALGGIISNTAHDYASTVDYQHISADLLQEIRDNIEVLIGLTNKPDVRDIFKVVTLYKQGQGSNYIPFKEDREFARIMTGSALPLNITTLFGTFVLTVQPGVWTSIDFPEGTSYLLDTTATPNSQNVYIRFTNMAPAN